MQPVKVVTAILAGQRIQEIALEKSYPFLNLALSTTIWLKCL